MRDRRRLPSSKTGVGPARGNRAVGTTVQWSRRGVPRETGSGAASLSCSSMPWAHPVGVRVQGLSPWRGSRDRARRSISERGADCRPDSSLGLVFPEHVPRPRKQRGVGSESVGLKHSCSTFQQHDLGRVTQPSESPELSVVQQEQWC